MKTQLIFSTIALVFLESLIISQVNAADVIIIGAGVAGLSAADWLLQQGHFPIILEARNRTGGRIWTDDSFGYPLDFGASILSMANTSEVFIQAQRSNIRSVPLDYKDFRGYSTSFTANRMATIRSNLTTMGQRFSEFLQENRTAVLEDHSINDLLFNMIFRNDLDRFSQALLHYWIYSEIEVEYGSGSSFLSKRLFDFSQNLKGQDQYFPEGFLRIFDRMISKIDIRLNHVVNNVTQVGRRVYVTTTNGTVFQADFAIITAPLGVLKKGSIHISPRIPAAKVRALEAMQAGSLEKILVEFSEKFWDDVSILKVVNLPLSPLGFIINLYPMNTKNVLMFMIVGDYPVYNYYNKTEAQLRSDITRLMRGIFRGKNVTITQIKATNWKNDPFSLGSHISYGLNSTKNSIPDINQPHGRIDFAGEHCYVELAHTVNGAFLSGQLAAERIEQLANKKLRNRNRK
jgi:polyamine oxidase